MDQAAFLKLIDELKNNSIEFSKVPKLHKDQAHTFCATLRTNNSVKTLIIIGWEILEAGEFLGETLKVNIYVTRLDIFRCKISWKHLSDGLKINNSIQKLFIKDNNIGVEGCKYLSEALKLNNSLQELNLDNNSIGDEGCKYLSEALKLNNSLKQLYLNNNSIGDEGCGAICRVLKVNNTLERLYLDKNDISNKGCESLGEALLFNNTLIGINFWNSKIEPSAYQVLLEKLHNNYSIIECNINPNLANKTILMKIEERLKLNKKFKLQFRRKDDLDWERIQLVSNLNILIIEECSIKDFPFPLQTLKSLEVLDLKNNELNSQFIQVLSNFLVWNYSLKILNLQGNKTLGDEEGEKLLWSLSLNISLIECNLIDTLISKEIQEQIKIKLKANYPLTQISFKELCSKEEYATIAGLVVFNKEESLVSILDNMNSESIDGVFFMCCAWDKIDLCKLVLNKHDFNINFQLDGNTCLHLSVMKDNYEITLLLIERGIDINILNNEQKLAKDLCVDNGKCKSLFESKKQQKVVVVGTSGAGKTTLIKKILNASQGDDNLILKTKLKEKIFAKDSQTYGIEMKEWKCGLNTDLKDCTIRFWDFGGQELFYTTHQLFLSQNNLNLIVFDLTDKFMEKELIFWLNSIQYRAPKSKVIIIGSHMDKIDPKLMEEEINMASNRIKIIYDKTISFIKNEAIELIPCYKWKNPLLREHYKNKLWFFPISGTEEWNIKYLENLIIRFSYKNILESSFLEAIEELKILEQKKLERGEIPIFSRDEIKKKLGMYFKDKIEIMENFLKLLHELGIILNFGDSKPFVVSPEWLSNVIRFINSRAKAGIITEDIIRFQCEEDLSFQTQKQLKSLTQISLTQISNPDRRRTVEYFSLPFQVISFPTLLNLLQDLQICSPYIETEKSGIRKFFVFALMNQDQPSDILSLFNQSHLMSTSNSANEANREILVRKYLFPFIPNGVFETLSWQISTFLRSNMKFWKNGFAFMQDNSYLVLEIKIPKYQPRDKLDEIEQEIENFHKGIMIELKSKGNLACFLISAFHSCIESVFKNNFPYLWNIKSIEVEFYSDQDRFTNSLNNCLDLWEKNKNEQIKTMSGLSIPWEKLIPEQFAYINQNEIQEKYFIISFCRLEEKNSSALHLCKLSNQQGIYLVKKLSKEFFNKEFDLIKNFDHPNITKLLKYEMGSHFLFFVLYHTSLAELQKEKCELEKNWWTDSQIKIMYLDILKGLNYLHSKFIAHLDIRLENILVYDESRYCIYGFTNAIQLNKEDSTVEISKDYKAPEISEDYKAPEINTLSRYFNPFKADIFSFGILLCAIVSNNPKLYLQKNFSQSKENKFEEVILDCLNEDYRRRPNTSQLLEMGKFLSN